MTYKNISKLPILDAFLSEHLSGSIDNILMENTVYTLINGVSRINFFIGKNNSGKSYIIKSLLRSHPELHLKNESLTYNNQFHLYSANHLTQKLQEIISQYSLKLEKILLTNSVVLIEYAINSKLLIQQQEWSTVNQLPVREFVDTLFDVRGLKKITFEKHVNLLRSLLSHHLLQDNWNALTLINQNGVRTNIDEVIFALIIESIETISKELVTVSILYQWLQLDEFYYVPVLRTLKNFTDLSNPSKLNQSDTSNTLNSKSNIRERNEKELNTSGVHIVDGQDFFDIVYSNANSSYKNRKALREYEDFLSLYFFDGKNVQLISNMEDGEEFQRHQVRIVIEEEERFLDEMGDGIQQIIMLTYPLFLSSGGMFVIEEPEINLEPRIQKKLIEIYSTHPKAQSFIFFISTHSNNIIDSLIADTTQTALFSVNKVRNDNERYLAGIDVQISNELPRNYNNDEYPRYYVKKLTKPTTDLLHQLGVKPSSLIMTNGVIWVEGPSDVIYIDAWLRIYQLKTFGEIRYERGIHYEFLMYGGSLLSYYNNDESVSIAQADSATRSLVNMMKINPHYFVVFDSDIVNGKDISSFGLSKQIIKASLPENSRWLDESVQTIESYIPIEYTYKQKQRTGSKTSYASVNASTWFERINENNFNWSDFPASLRKYIKNLYEAIEYWNK